MALHLRGYALPSGHRVELWTDRDRITYTPMAGARTLADEAVILPGLVDVHTHPGAGVPGAPLDEQALRVDLLAHRRAGVTAVRVLGAPERLPAWVDGDAELPRVLSAAPWLTTPGLFFPGCARCVEEDALPDAAAEEAKAHGWVKLRGDWIVDEETHARPHILPATVLDEAVHRVHDAGGRVAVHAMHATTCAAAVDAGVDSIEHALWLDHALLPAMAERGIALTPTYTVWARQLDAMREMASPAREWFLDGYARLGSLTVAAHHAGVTVLAGTDSQPHGSIATEVRHLAAGGLPADVALGAACWAARAFLGLPELEEGAPADLVVYDRDPLADLAVLDHPAHVILRGDVVNSAR